MVIDVLESLLKEDTNENMKQEKERLLWKGVDCMKYRKEHDEDAEGRSASDETSTEKEEIVVLHKIIEAVKY